MISASIGSHRFESGPTYHFNGSSFADLSETVIDPTATTEYVNGLPGVNATSEEMQQVAASGIARLVIDSPYTLLLEQAGTMLIDVCDGKPIDTDPFFDFAGRDVFHGRGLQNEILDSASVLATRKNRAEETAALIENEAPTDNGYFFIALANGGLISAARTRLHLSEGDHVFGMVGYSVHKLGDKAPRMHPYPDDRKEWFGHKAENRQVVVYDEDYGTRETLKTATNYFAGLLNTKVIGISPVEVERRITYKPLVITSE